MLYELSFWGGPKDGGVEKISSPPPDEIYCTDDDSPLLNVVEVYQQLLIKENHKAFARYKAEKISKTKYKYVYSGII